MAVPSSPSASPANRGPTPGSDTTRRAIRLGRRNGPVCRSGHDRRENLRGPLRAGGTVPQRGLGCRSAIHLFLRPHDLGMDSPPARDPRRGRRLRGDVGPIVGTFGRDHPGGLQHDRQFPLCPVLPGVVTAHHGSRRLRHLGSVPLQPRRCPGINRRPRMATRTGATPHVNVVTPRQCARWRSASFDPGCGRRTPNRHRNTEDRNRSICRVGGTDDGRDARCDAIRARHRAQRACDEHSAVGDPDMTGRSGGRSLTLQPSCATGGAGPTRIRVTTRHRLNSRGGRRPGMRRTRPSMG